MPWDAICQPISQNRTRVPEGNTHMDIPWPSRGGIPSRHQHARKASHRRPEIMAEEMQIASPLLLPCFSGDAAMLEELSAV